MSDVPKAPGQRGRQARQHRGDVFPDHASDAERLLSQADLALYAVK